MVHQASILLSTIFQVYPVYPGPTPSYSSESTLPNPASPLIPGLHKRDTSCLPCAMCSKATRPYPTNEIWAEVRYDELCQALWGSLVLFLYFSDPQPIHRNYISRPLLNRREKHFYESINWVWGVINTIGQHVWRMKKSTLPRHASSLRLWSMSEGSQHVGLSSVKVQLWMVSSSFWTSFPHLKHEEINIYLSEV